MKHFFFLFVLLLANFAFAQYGQQNLYQSQQQHAPNQSQINQQLYQPQNNPYYFYIDSTAYYQNLIDTYTRSGLSKRRAGIGMMIGGGIAAVVGFSIMIKGLSDLDNNDCHDNYYGYCEKDEEDEAATNIAIAGYLITLGGAAVLTAGLVVKIVSNSKLRKAECYRNSLELYKQRKIQALELQIEPLINARKGSYGSRLSLNF